MGEKIITLISKEAIDKRVAELAREISAGYAEESGAGSEAGLVSAVCVLKGAFIFAADLVRHMDPDLNVQMDFMDVSSYGKGMTSSANMSLVLDMQEDPAGKHILLIEDIADTGRSINFIRKHLLDRGAASVKLCVLLDKPGSRVINNVSPDYVGFTIPDKFVIGYGLDFAQRYRNLPFVGYIDFSD